MSLPSSDIEYLAQKAQWYIDCKLQSNLGRYSPFHGDSVVITGDGVDDIDRLLALMAGYPNGRFAVDVGRVESAYRPFTIEDAHALRTAYIKFWGTVSKPFLPEDDLESVDMPR